MKNLIIALLMVMVFPALGQAAAGAGQVDRPYDPADLFTGDKRMACEAVLCLSSPHRPSECAPSIKWFYGIRKYRHGSFSLSRTIRARKNFLQLCPSNGDVNIDQLATALSKTMNQCDADYLNTRRIYYAKAYDVLRGQWNGWQLLGRNNDDYGSRKTDKPESNTRYSFSARSFPACSQRQLDYRKNMDAGTDGPGRGRKDDGGWEWVHPVALVCYESRAEIDPNAPQDCQELFNSNYSHYSDQKYENGKWETR